MSTFCRHLLQKKTSAGLQSGAVRAHPAEPGCFFYAAANGVVCVYDVRWARFFFFFGLREGVVSSTHDRRALTYVVNATSSTTLPLPRATPRVKCSCAATTAP